MGVPGVGIGRLWGVRNAPVSHCGMSKRPTSSILTPGTLRSLGEEIGRRRGAETPS